jgi:pyridoxal phosphate enzyme (YggS family)
MSIKANLSSIKNSFHDPDCLLVAVSKTQPIATILEAYEAGIRDFGENKVQELTSKQAELPSDIRWHFIGHLQTNKVKYIAPFVHLIHGVDSWKLLLEINKQAEKSSRVVSCLLQIYIAQEETKFGLDGDELKVILQNPELQHLKNVRIVGLMGMASFTEDLGQVRKEFKYLKNLFDECQSLQLPENVQLSELSMGMSGDYLIAQEEGSTMVRIGTAIFGERNYSKR